MVSFSFLAVAAVALNVVLAHSDGKPLFPIEEHLERSRRSLSDCQAELANPERLIRRQQKQNELVNKHLAARGISEPRFESSLMRRAAKHKFPAPVQCILAPELTIGPYWVPGEKIREDISEGHPGVDMLLDVQFVDVNTCKPIPNMIVEYWHCNSTGIYSGVTDYHTVGENQFRGNQITDEDGVTQVKTKFPGWYTDRAVHIHVMTNLGGKILPNGTYSGGKVNHVGQIFFPEDILKKFETEAIYKTNTMARLANAGDFIYQQGIQTSKAVPDATVELLGSKLSDGVLAYLTIAVDPKADHSADVFPAGSFVIPTGPWPSGSYPPLPSGFTFPSGWTFPGFTATAPPAGPPATPAPTPKPTATK